MGERSGTAELMTAQDTMALGAELGRELRAGDVVVLSGPLGAGKTVLAKGIAEAMDVEGPVLSPTFVLARLLQTFSSFELDEDACPATFRPPKGWKGAPGRKGIERFRPAAHLTNGFARIEG